MATEATDFVAASLEGVGRGLHRAMDALSAEKLNRCPSPDTNSMARLCWHLARCQDNWVASIAGAPEVYAADGWHAKLDFSFAIDDWGIGHAAEQVAQARVESADGLLGYYDAVAGQSRKVLAGLTAEDLERELPVYVEGRPPSSVRGRLMGLISDNTQHMGQIVYLRGLFAGLGWKDR